MFILKKKARGMTLMEVIISSILMAIALAGLANIFVVGKRFIQHARFRTAGGELGRVFIEPLGRQVRQDTWDTAGNQLQLAVPAQVDSRSWSGAAQTIGGKNYTPRYTVSRLIIAGADSGLRRVQLNVNWHEEQ